MTDLSVAEYDQAEESAISTSTNLINEAFRPIIFLNMGYPDRVRREAELFKYMDAMHEAEFELHCWQPAQMGQFGTREIRGVEELGRTP